MLDVHSASIFRQSLRLRLILAAEAVLLATVALIAWSGNRLLDDSLLLELRTRVAQVEPLLAAALSPALARHEREDLAATLSGLGVGDRFAYVVAFDRDGKIAGQSGWDDRRPLPSEDTPDALPADRSFDGRVALRHDGVNVGSVRYGLSLDALLAARSHLYANGALIVALGLLASLGALLYLGWALTRELARVSAGARRMADGNLSVRLPTDANGELGELARSLNTLAANLEARLREVRANEERLALVIQGTSDGVWDWDIVSGQRYYSPRFRELLGFPDEKTFRLLFAEDAALHPDDRERVLEARRRHLELHEPFDQEYRLRCHDGEFRWFRGRAQAVWNAAGRAARFAGSITDIDDRHAAEDALRESEERFQHVVQGSSEGIWDWDLKRKRYHISSRMKSLLGYGDDELPNERASFFRVIDPADLDRVQREINDHFTQRRPFDTELRLRHKDGSVSWYRARGQAVWGADGQVLRFSGACSSIMVQKEAAERIRELLAEKQILIDNVQVGIAFVRQGAIASTNRRMEQLFGFGAGDMVGHPAGMFFRDPAEFDAIARECHTLDDAEQPLSREYELQRRNGTTFWGLVTGKPLNPRNPDEGAIWIFFDNTEHRHVVEALKNERDFSDSLINGMPGVFYLADRDGRLLRWNRNLERVTGFAAAQLATMHAIDLYAPEVRPAVQEATFRTLKQGENQRELALCTHGGERIPYLMAAMKLELDGMTHIMGIGFDIAPRIAAEEQVRHLNDELELRVRARTAELAAANKELESFAYSVSHDLSAPLRGIDGFSRMLAEDFGSLLPEVGRSYIARIRAASQRMQQLIDDLLRLSRVTRDELQREPLDMSAMVREIVDELRTAQPERVVGVVVAPGLMVSADRNLLRIALSNLLRNAWKFTSRHASASIEFGVLRQADQSVYFVKDDGAGFDMRYAGRLFGAFHRLHRSSEFEGTGIGLAIVSRILLRHGGRIWAEAEVDKGATFYFTLG